MDDMEASVPEGSPVSTRVANIIWGIQRDQKKPGEIANEIVEQWACAKMRPLDIPKGRLWILKKEIADAIRHERVMQMRAVDFAMKT